MFPWQILCGLALALFATGCRRSSEPPPARADSGLSDAAADAPVVRHRAGGTDVTFLVTADTHFGVGVPADADPARDPLMTPLGIERTHRDIVWQMNELESRPYPPALGGWVKKPRGLLVAGDITDSDTDDQWRSFRAYYGTDGRDGLLRFPVYEAVGNHDYWKAREKVKARHGALYFSFDFDDVHLICLGEAPDDAALAWLRSDLAKVGKDVPVVVFMHFPLLGPFSDNWFGNGNYRERLAETIAGYNVIAFFHGHYHAAGTYRWKGYDVYNVGSAKHAYRSFGVARVTDTRFSMAEYNYQLRSWWYWHEKPINGAAGEDRVGERPKKSDDEPVPYVER